MDTGDLGTRGAAVAALLALAGLTGCSPAILSVDDVVYVRGRPTLFVAHVEREPWPGIRDGIGDVEITFTVGQRAVARAETDHAGRAEITQGVGPPASDRVSATAKVDGRTLRETARVYRWDDDVPVLAVDVDETICWPAYFHIFFGPRNDVVSQPVEGSREALTELAQDFHILYISARPRFLLDMTRQWLARQGFPPGPMITSQELTAVLAQSDFKRDELARLRKHFPNLLIGIGDKGADIDGFRQNDMLTLIVGRSSLWGEPEHAVALRDWPTLLRFVKANMHVLGSTQSLARALKNGGTWRQVAAVSESR